MTSQTPAAPLVWDEGLTLEQRDAVAAPLLSSRLLAGPGTGNTLVMARRVLYMVQEHHVPPAGIAALTFTRAAAFELRRRTGAGLPGGHVRVSTIHSFALRQLLRNWDKVRTLPEPLRIEDDWELRWVILEDLKDLLNRTVRDVRKALHSLAADWHRLKPDQEGWDKEYPDPAFLGAWREHRAVFGYVLRSELVYLLNQALRAF